MYFLINLISVISCRYILIVFLLKQIQVNFKFTNTLIDYIIKCKLLVASKTTIKIKNINNLINALIILIYFRNKDLY